MAEKNRTKYKAEYSEKNYDRYTILFPKGQREVFKKAAAASGKSLNAFMVDLARDEASRVLENEFNTVKNYSFTEKPTPCHAANVVFYIDSTKPQEFPSEPFRIAVVNFDSGAILYRNEFTTVYTADGDSISNANKPTAEDISLIMGYLECETVFTYDIERLSSLTESWGIDINANNIHSLNNGTSLMDAIGMADKSERDLRPYEIAQKLREYALKTL